MKTYVAGETAELRGFPGIPSDLRTLRDLTIWVDRMPLAALQETVVSYMHAAERARGRPDFARHLVVVSVMCNRIIFELMEIPQDAAALLPIF